MPKKFHYYTKVSKHKRNQLNWFTFAFLNNIIVQCLQYVRTLQNASNVVGHCCHLTLFKMIIIILYLFLLNTHFYVIFTFFEIFLSSSKKNYILYSVHFTTVYLTDRGNWAKCTAFTAVRMYLQLRRFYFSICKIIFSDILWETRDKSSSNFFFERAFKQTPRWPIKQERIIFHDSCEQ